MQILNSKLYNSQSLRLKKQVDFILQKPKPNFVGTKPPTSDIFEKKK